jgi:hypothetical protein
MKLIKEYKNLLETKWTEKDPGYYDITNYTWNEDGTLDVNGWVILQHRRLTKLPFKFGRVNGNFFIYSNLLTSLEGCPREVTGNFNCAFNQITSLEGAPRIVGYNFRCYYNLNLTKLKGFPRKVGGDVHIYNCGVDIDTDYIRARCDIGGELITMDLAEN